ncbi:monocarboxylate transporter 13-like isoform X2 [Agrilus planipennis]|uniref:Monocarboxylate transporter 13-like isoform X2 n=1 Tax=Agrilus planipennis TaxID=224129 RepID=A0A7F5R612_AGRPL|nr:monocarboxylate transporter 13-like isoform X2 [Agrilus planipennis]
MAEKGPSPPDGGWGWIIVLAFAVNTVISIPIMTSFGLLFKDTFSQLGLSATDSAIIINTNQAFGMMMGLINGALLRKYGYRKIAIMSAVCMTLGVTLTAFAKTFTHFMISFGLLTSLGMGLGMSSYSLALNTYFLKNRGKATGIAFTITGLGPIGMPQLISMLMNTYGSRGAVLVLAGIAAHTFPASFLLQPVKWHWKYEETEEKTQHNNNIKNNEAEVPFLEKPQQSPPSEIFYSISTTSVDKISLEHPSPLYVGQSLPSLSEGYPLEPTKTKWWSSQSIPSINLASSVKIFEEKEKRLSVVSAQKQNDDREKKYSSLKKIDEDKESAKSKDTFCNPDESVQRKKESCFKKLMENIIHTFDLRLLTDKVYLNIMFGISLAVFAEMNFAMLTPFMLAEFDLQTSQIATFMSIIAVTDLIFRFISPFIGDFLKKTPRIMYLISLIMLIAVRFAFIIVLDYKGLLVVAAFLGIAKGVRTVYMTLVIPSHVPLERLASASGIQMVTNGFVFIFGGPLIGFIRDVSGTYRNCVMLMNLFTFITILMWTGEMTYRRIKSSKAKTTENEQT